MQSRGSKNYSENSTINFVDKIGAWLVGVILNWLLKRAQYEYEKIQDQKEREKINTENSVKYEEAKTRAEKIKSAIDLINRQPSN